MSTMPTIPMISPDGTIGDVPLHQTNAASQQGFKVGKEVEINGQKGVIPFERYGEFMKLHGPITGTDATPQVVQQTPQAGVIDTPKRFLSSLLGTVGGAASGIYHGVTDDAQGADETGLNRAQLIAKRLVGDPIAQQAAQSDAARKSGDYSSAVGHGLAALIPGVGPFAAQLADTGSRQVGQGDYAGAAGTAAGAAALAYAPKVLGRGAGAVLADSKVGVLDPLDTSMRGVVKSVNPAGGVKMANALLDNMKAIHGNVQDYIRANNLDAGKQLPYAKAAEMYGDSQYGKYRSLVDPVSEQRVNVPSTYQGAGANDVRSGTGLNEMKVVGKKASIRDIEKRIGDINDQNYRDDASEAPASDARTARDLEHGQLTNVLHSTIAQSLNDLNPDANITPQDVADLRQSFGKAHTVSRIINDAVTQRSSNEARIAQGTKIGAPHSALSVPVELANHYIRGGPNKIADRMFSKAIANAPTIVNQPRLSDYIRMASDGVSTPDEAPATPQRAPLYASMSPDQPSLADVDVTPDAATVKMLSDRMAARKASVLSQREQVPTPQGTTDNVMPNTSQRKIAAQIDANLKKRQALANAIMQAKQNLRP